MSTSRQCSSQMTRRGPDSAGVAVYRDPAPDGWSKLDALLRRRRHGLGRLERPRRRARSRRPRAATRSCSRGDADAAEACVRSEHPGATGDERGPRDRDLQGGRPAARLSPSSSRLADFQGTHGARPHADGDREPGHDGGLAPVLDGARPLPRAQRLALEPQPAARAAPARGHRVPDRERHRGRGRAT